MKLEKVLKNDENFLFTFLRLLLDPLQYIDIQFICIYFQALLVIYYSYKRY